MLAIAYNLEMCLPKPFLQIINSHIGINSECIVKYVTNLLLRTFILSLNSNLLRKLSFKQT